MNLDFRVVVRHTSFESGQDRIWNGRDVSEVAVEVECYKIVAAVVDRRYFGGVDGAAGTVAAVPCSSSRKCGSGRGGREKTR